MKSIPIYYVKGSNKRIFACLITTDQPDGSTLLSEWHIGIVWHDVRVQKTLNGAKDDAHSW
tara:strand:+ start:110 stop:292 length:183 start_codon:yes stop_codon:yes gene_type:complete